VSCEAHFTPEALVVRNCTFQGNTTPGFGGGLRARLSNTKISHCAFIGNQAFYGGGVALMEYGENRLDDCLFVGNTASRYGGAVFSSGTDTFSHLTLTGNHAAGAIGAGGGIYVGWSRLGSWSSSLSLANSILWQNTTESGNGPELANHNTAGVVLQVDSSDVQGGLAGVYVQGGALNWGAGNISADPLFVGPPAANYRLAAGSPAIDAANNALVPPDRTDIDGDGDTNEPVPLDLDLGPRFVEDPGAPNTGSGTRPIVDKGAYERKP
jgi:predicted outer membrane repeat protein